jgi:hypothetical protein
MKAIRSLGELVGALAAVVLFAIAYANSGPAAHTTVVAAVLLSAAGNSVALFAQQQITREVKQENDELRAYAAELEDDLAYEEGRAEGSGMGSRRRRRRVSRVSRLPD